MRKRSSDLNGAIKSRKIEEKLPQFIHELVTAKIALQYCHETINQLQNLMMEKDESLKKLKQQCPSEIVRNHTSYQLIVSLILQDKIDSDPKTSDFWSKLLNQSLKNTEAKGTNGYRYMIDQSVIRCWLTISWFGSESIFDILGGDSGNKIFFGLPNFSNDERL